MNPITPPPELIAKWASEFYGTDIAPGEAIIAIATEAAHWGADVMLEACCEWARDNDGYDAALALRADLRPNFEPEEPTVMQIIALADEIEKAELGQVDLVRAALARWGNHPIRESNQCDS